MKALGCLLHFVLLAVMGLGQANKNFYEINAARLTGTITLDGKLNEVAWREAEAAENFILNFPVDSLAASSQTEIMFIFDDQYLYIGGRCYEPAGSRYIVQSLRRDFEPLLNENVGILFDPYNDYTNGFAFGISPLGVQLEGLVTNGQDISLDWDNEWRSEVWLYEDHWEFEMVIPFKTFRYNQESSSWNIKLIRIDLKNNEWSTWPPVPQGYPLTSFAFSGKLFFNEHLPDPGANVAFIPYTSVAVTKDHLKRSETRSDLDMGFDAKVGVSASLNLDLTVNPDFSQVEVDQQVTNLSRFELFFPEKRQFFLENQDLFGEGGFPESRPFFSRRIGIARDSSGNNVQIPILFGARLSGKVGENWRIGLLNMNTGPENGIQLTGVNKIPGAYRLLTQNYTFAVVQRKIFARSNIGAFVVNRQALGYDEHESIANTTKYNRVAGIDYNLFSADGKWEGDFFYHRSIDPGREDAAYASGAFLGFTDRNLSLGVGASAIGAGYNAELGFVPRKDIFNIATFNSYRFYPAGKSGINNHGPGIDLFYFTDLDLNKTDFNYTLYYNFTFENTAFLSFRSEYHYEKLRAPFDPTRTGGASLREGSDYAWRTYGLAVNTDTRKLFSVALEGSFGGFYNGRRINLSGLLNYRYQPFGSITLLVDYNKINLPSTFKDAQFWLIGPRIDLTFTDKLFLTTFVQYNEQEDNININARFQWRYKPVSDIFVVYTDNYFPGDLLVKNRALVFKITYWLNI